MPVQHETRVRGYLADADSFLVVAEDGADLVGMALGMQALADDGAGPPLMRSLLAEARRRGYVDFQLWTHADNRRAQSLYEGLGFRRSGREKDDDLGAAIVHYQLSR